MEKIIYSLNIYMSSNYELKYLEVKLKYLELKNKILLFKKPNYELQGGGSNIKSVSFPEPGNQVSEVHEFSRTQAQRNEMFYDKNILSEMIERNRNELLYK